MTEKQNQTGPWYNYRTGACDLYATPTDETISDYLPQNPAALSMYRLYRNFGDLTVLQSMANVLLAVLGEPPVHVASFEQEEAEQDTGQ